MGFVPVGGGAGLAQKVVLEPGGGGVAARHLDGHVAPEFGVEPAVHDPERALAQNGLGGAVPIENIGGRAEFITFSLDGSANWNPLSWAGSFRSGRAGSSLHPERPAE